MLSENNHALEIRMTREKKIFLLEGFTGDLTEHKRGKILSYFYMEL